MQPLDHTTNKCHRNSTGLFVSGIWQSGHFFSLDESYEPSSSIDPMPLLNLWNGFSHMNSAGTGGEWCTHVDSDDVVARV
jgi:hypothetical protein